MSIDSVNIVFHNKTINFSLILYTSVGNESGFDMQIQQKEIAELAGVSYATVSRALNGTAKVKPETMQKIRNAMHQLGIVNYDDIFIGKNILSKHILVTVGDISYNFFAEIYKAIYSVLQPLGYSLVLCNSGFDTELELDCMKKASENGYAGIIMLTANETPELLSFILESRIPVIIVNRRIRAMDLDTVRVDNYREGYIAAQHLFDNGHRNVAILSGPTNSITAKDCERGFTDCARDNGISFSKDCIVHSDLSPKSAERFVKWLHERDFRYTGLFIVNDHMASSVVHCLARYGIRVPHDISMICQDDSPLVNESGLNMTVICSNPDVLGAKAAEIFLSRHKDLLGERTQIVFPPQLIQRSSIKRIK